LYNIINNIDYLQIFWFIILHISVYLFTVLKIKKKNIHRGQLLLQIIAESGLSITQLVKKVGISRSSYYNHTVDPELSLDILLKYGKVLRHDFMEDFPDLLGNKLNEADRNYVSLSKADTLEEAERQRDIWKDKYYVLLEKYHLLKEQIEERE